MSSEEAGQIQAISCHCEQNDVAYIWDARITRDVNDFSLRLWLKLEITSRVQVQTIPLKQVNDIVCPNCQLLMCLRSRPWINGMVYDRIGYHISPVLRQPLLCVARGCMDDPSSSLRSPMSRDWSDDRVLIDEWWRYRSGKRLTSNL